MSLFKKPKPDPELERQRRIAEEARLQTLQEDLADETTTRSRVYGRVQRQAAIRAAGLAGAAA
jgi:hypothetical protein